MQARELSATPISRAYTTYVVGMFMLAYTFNYLDRQILAILAEPIKADLGLRDWQLGFLTGTSFALFYATLGIPIARLADRWHRVNILALSLALWSAMTAVCGTARSFVELATARICVGIGEAGGSPPAVSLLSDYVPESTRTTALGFYNLGVPLGTLLGFVAGGWINQLYGWRVAFLVVGIPGILLAIAIKLTIKEPARKTEARASAEAVANRSALMTLWRNTLYRRTILAAALYAITANVFFLWTPANMMRTYNLDTGTVGTVIGLLAGIGGGLGSLLGGWLADRLCRQDPRWVLWVPALAMSLFFPVVSLGLLAETWQGYAILISPAFILVVAVNAPVWSMTQSAVPPEIRATSAAVMLFVVNLIGLGIGPQLAGLISDLLQPRFGNNSLHVAIPLVTAIAWASAFQFWRAAALVQGSRVST